MTKAMTPAQTSATIADIISRNEDKFLEVMPSAMTKERLLRVATNLVTKTPKLLECTPQSLLGAMMQSAMLGIELGDSLGLAYLIPYSTKRGVCEAQFQLGYRGLIELALRSPQVLAIRAQTVWTWDEYEYVEGTAPNARIVHIRRPPPGSGAIPSSEDCVAAYAVGTLVGNAETPVWLWRDEIELRRSSSRSGQDGPWFTHYGAMARKTAIRELSKFLPLTADVRDVVNREQMVEVGVARPLTHEDFIDVTHEETPASA